MEPKRRGTPETRAKKNSADELLDSALGVFAILLLGLWLTEFWHWGNHRPGTPLFRYVGWILVVIGLWRLPVMLRGIVRLGLLLVGLLIAGALAFLVGGDDALWNLFF